MRMNIQVIENSSFQVSENVSKRS